MKPAWLRLEPTATTLSEVRWFSAFSYSDDVLVRKFRRERDAIAFANKLRDRKSVTDVRVWTAPVGRWREAALPEVDAAQDDQGWWG